MSHLKRNGLIALFYYQYGFWNNRSTLAVTHFTITDAIQKILNILLKVEIK